MEFLKWTGSLILSVIGISAVIGIITLLAVFGSIIGAAFLGFFVVVFIAMAIREYFEEE